MGELQPTHYFHGFINIFNWAILIFSTFIFRKNLTEAKTLGVTTNPNFLLLQLIPYINIVALPLILKKVELQLNITQGHKQPFGFIYSLASTVFLFTGGILSQIPHYFLGRYYQHMEEGKSEEASMALKLSEQLLTSNLFAIALLFITFGQAAFYFKIYKMQKNTIMTLGK